MALKLRLRELCECGQPQARRVGKFIELLASHKCEFTPPGPVHAPHRYCDDEVVFIPADKGAR